MFGVNNKDGVFLNSYQKGSTFNAPYKRIRKDWFFHNPTRSNVGSLGIVPDVPEDAITSPEYQVWRIRPDATESLLPGYVACLIQTPFFLGARPRQLTARRAKTRKSSSCERDESVRGCCQFSGA